MDVGFMCVAELVQVDRKKTHLVFIQVDEEATGQGLANEMMRIITARADQNSDTLALNVAVQAGSPPMAVNALVRWFEALGFIAPDSEENPYYMVRSPSTVEEETDAATVPEKSLSNA